MLGVMFSHHWMINWAGGSGGGGAFDPPPHKFCRSVNPNHTRGPIPNTLLLIPPPTVCWRGVLCRNFLGIKMQHWNACLSSLFKDFVSFWSTILTLRQRDAWKKLILQKLVKDASNLASFYGSYMDGIVCVK